MPLSHLFLTLSLWGEIRRKNLGGGLSHLPFCDSRNTPACLSLRSSALTVTQFYRGTSLDRVQRWAAHLPAAYRGTLGQARRASIPTLDSGAFLDNIAHNLLGLCLAEPEQTHPSLTSWRRLPE